jgi:adenylylsulfate kinase-like enzyme
LAPAWLWLFKAAVTRALDRSLQQQLENHKHELQALGDKLRHNLQRQMVLAELRSKRVFEVYPKVYEVMQLSGAAIRAVQEVKIRPHSEDELQLARVVAKDRYIEAKNYRAGYLFGPPPDYTSCLLLVVPTQKSFRALGLRK